MRELLVSCGKMSRQTGSYGDERNGHVEEPQPSPANKHDWGASLAALQGTVSDMHLGM